MNKDIDFLIYSDCNYTGYLPQNVKIRNTTLFNIKKKTEEVVGFDISLDRAYKLCDLRPLFGKIFEQDLKKYDFWGYCDLDVIFGNIRKFITDNILEKYDKVNRWGHLSIQRNNKECNERYKLESTRYSYKQVLTNSRDFGFDECDYTNIFEKYHYPIYYLPNNCFADIRARHKRFCKQGSGNVNTQVFCWNKGSVYRDYLLDDQIAREEYLYIHFKKRGPLKVHINDDEIKNINGFYITNSGFYPKKENTDVEIIEKLNPYPGKTYEQFEDMRYKINGLKTKFRRKYFD